MAKKFLGVLLLVLVPLVAGAQDKSKKTYELIYDDVQALKEQVRTLQTRLDGAAEEIRALRDQIKVLSDLVRQSIADQAGARDSLNTIPAQYQDMLRKIDQITLDVQKLSADLAASRAEAAAAAQAPPEKAPKEPAPKKKAEPQPQTQQPQQPQQQPTQTPPAAPPRPAANISPQEAYSMAYSDYLKGNYDLAIESFKLYRQQFPDSPLADNALYWIGECYFSEKKFAEAIDAFNELILTYPQGDKAAAGYLKKGISYAELGKKEEALAAFKLLIAKYPLQDEAKIAQDKIKELEQR